MRLAVCLALVLSFGCMQPGKEARLPLGNQLALGMPVEVDNLTVWPVFSEVEAPIGTYRTLEEAREKGEVAIREQEEAQVATLVLENKGAVPILACAGTVIGGGKQDRQLGEDIVVEAGASVSVKAFCVEPGRWHGSTDFEAAGQMASREVRSAAQYDDDQAGVWYDIEVAQAASIVPRGSYRSAHETEGRRRTTADKVIAHLRSQEGNLVGYAYAVDGEVAGMRAFAHRRLMEPRLESFVQALCVEAELGARSGSLFRDVGVDFRGLGDFVPPQITQVGVDEDCDTPLSGGQAGDGPTLQFYDVKDLAKSLGIDRLVEVIRETVADSPETEVQTKNNVLVVTATGDAHRAIRGRLSDLRSRARPRTAAKPKDVAAFVRALDAAPEEVAATEGANRNGYRRSDTGNHSTCYVKDASGRWIPIARDWSAR